MQQAFIVTGLGYGDEGKGSVVDWLTHRHKAHTVIRTGGPQALHRVVTSDGREHVFQQFGSGTFRGAATHLSKHMLVAPHALLREAAVLRQVCGYNPLTNLTIHEHTPIILPIQGICGRIRELARSNNRRGTVGVGVGETIRDQENQDMIILHAADLETKLIPELVSIAWEQKQAECRAIAKQAIDSGSKLAEQINEQLAMVTDSLLKQTIYDLEKVRIWAKVINDKYVAKHILDKDGTVIVEGSQGVLLDRVHGFYPYTTKVRATPETARDILTTGHYAGKVTSLGVVRSYATRHGHGPFVTEDASLTQALPDKANKTDPWQGTFRVGHFDAVATRYAATACGAGAIDGLVVTCLDRTADLPIWSICTAYQHEATALPDGTGALMEKTENLFDIQTNGPDSMSQFFTQCQPVLQHYEKNRTSPWSRQESQAMQIQHCVGIPVYAISTGETECDKMLVQQPVVTYV